MRKHLFLLFAVVALLLTCTCSVFAHSGGTDENGGHYDYSTGEYHYHHGYSAHEHVDGECVFDFEDNGSSNASSRTKSKKSNKDSTPIWAYILIGSLLMLFIVPGAVTGIREGIREIKKKPSRENWFVFVMMILAILFGFVVPIVVSILVA